MLLVYIYGLIYTSDRSDKLNYFVRDPRPLTGLSRGKYLKLVLYLTTFNSHIKYHINAFTH